LPFGSKTHKTTPRQMSTENVPVGYWRFDDVHAKCLHEPDGTYSVTIYSPDFETEDDMDKWNQDIQTMLNEIKRRKNNG